MNIRVINVIIRVMYLVIKTFLINKNIKIKI